MGNKRKFTSKKKKLYNNQNKTTVSYAKKDLLTQSGILSDSTTSMNDILNKNKVYLNQFDTQTFDSNNVSSINDINPGGSDTKQFRIARDISLNGNWSSVDQNNYTYGIVPDSHLEHNNMLPYYKNRSTYGKNKEEDNSAKDRKMNLFMGADNDVYIHKTEIKPMFEPVPNGSFVYGMPNMNDFYQERVVPGRNYNGVNLFANDKVTPGIGLNANEIGTHGFHSMYRIMPKTVDELRTLNKQKVTHEGVMIEGLRGKKRNELGKTFLKKTDLSVDNNGENLLPNTAPEKAPVLKPNFVIKDTARQSQLMEYTGNPFNRTYVLENIVPEYMRPKYKQPSKHTYKNMKPTGKYARNSLIYNPNQKSFLVPTTGKDTVLTTDYIAPTYRKNVTYTNNNIAPETTTKESLDNYNYNTGLSQNKGNIIAPTMVPETTIKEILATADRPVEIIQSNTAHNFAINYNPLNTTMKELDTINKRLHVITDIKKGNVVNYQINPETTIKESTLSSFIPNNLESTKLGNYVSNYDPTPTTLGETTINEYDPRLTPIQKMPQLSNYLPTSTTIKETMSSVVYNPNMQSQLRSVRSNNINNPESTMKETILQDNNKFLDGKNQKSYITNSNPTKTTAKETLLFTANNIKSNENRNYVAYIKSPDTTSKETLGNIHYNNLSGTQKIYGNNIKNPKTTSQETLDNYVYNALSNSQRGIINNTVAKDTLRETLENHNYNIFSGSQKVYGNNVKTPDTTSKESLDNYNYNNIGSSSKIYTNGIKKLKTTTKESVLTDHNKIINISGGTKAYNKSDNFTFKSIKDTVNTERAGNINGLQQLGKVNDIKTTKTTGKETNLYERMGNIGNETKTYGEKQFLVPTTIKETMMERDVTGIGYSVDRPKGNGETFIQKLADRKEEIATRYRAPTQSNVDLNVGADMINMLTVNKTNTGYYLSRGQENEIIDRPEYYKLSKERIDIDIEKFVDPIILEQLKSNPYVRKN